VAQSPRSGGAGKGAQGVDDAAPSSQMLAPPLRSLTLTHLEQELQGRLLPLDQIHLCQPVHSCRQHMAARLLVIRHTLCQPPHVQGQDEAAMPHCCAGKQKAAVPAGDRAEGRPLQVRAKREGCGSLPCLLQVIPMPWRMQCTSFLCPCPAAHKSTACAPAFDVGSKDGQGCAVHST